MVKFNLIFDKEKAVKYLNKMSQQGWAMTGFKGGFFTFEKCEKGKYVYEVDFNSRFFSVTEDYRDFMNESGIEIVAHWGFWIFLRKLASEGEFNLYTDVDSQIEHYKKIRTLFKAAAILEILLLVTILILTEEYDSLILFGDCCLALAAIVVFVQMAFRMNDRIAKLTEIKTGMEAPKRRIKSNFLPIGLLFNAIALLGQESMPFLLHRTIQIAAIVFMLIGIYRSAHTNKN